MEIKITLENGQIALELFDQGNIKVDSVEWEGEYSVSEKLLSQIDNLLKKNNLTADDVKKVTPNVPENSSITSTRIIETIAAAWKM